MKRKSGLSLIELLVAMAVLAIILAPIMRLFQITTINAKVAGDLTAAAYTAQLRLEELKSYTLSELESIASSGFSDDPKYNGYNVYTQLQINYRGLPGIARAKVTVLSKDGEGMGSEVYSLMNVFRYGS